MLAVVSVVAVALIASLLALVESAAAAPEAAASTAPSGPSCEVPQQDTDFIGDNKLRFVAANWTACCDACGAIARCHYWTFEGTTTKPGPCFLKATSTTPAGHPHSGRVSGALGNHTGSASWPRPPTPPPTPPYSPPGPFRCESTLNCSLNGRCGDAVDPETNSTCQCFSGWRGKRCEVLDLLPAASLAGYRHHESGGNISSWGAPVLRHPLTGIYHAWPAEMTSHCGINSWERNSQVVHATSATPAGSYTRLGVVWPVFASEPSVALGPDGEAVMWWSMSHPGAGPPGGDECTVGCTDGQTVPSCNSNYTRGQTFTTYVSWTTDDAWTVWSKPLVIQEGTVTSQDTNMASVVLGNGSVVGLWRSKQFGGIHRVTAGHYREPASYNWHETGAALFKEAAHPLAPEDPFVWTTTAETDHPFAADGTSGQQQQQQHFHALFHHRSCSAPWVNRSIGYATVDCGGLAYSEDGVSWHYADTAGTAYQPLVEWQEEREPPYHFMRRERPHLVFDEEGQIAALSNGVVYDWAGQRHDGMHDASYSLMQPVRSGHNSHTHTHR
jgi:hypothetical protein|eukprot:COSAG06_NODE_1544_length_9139_cov_5.967035_2_plen_556_part_00